MLKAEQALPAPGRYGVNAAATETAKRPAFAFAPVMIVMTLVLGATVFFGVRALVDSSKILHRLEVIRADAATTVGRSEMDLLSRVSQWQLITILVALGGGVLLTALAAYAFRVRRDAVSREIKAREEEMRGEMVQLRARVTALNRITDEARKEQQLGEERLAELAKSNTKLSEELNQRRQTEKNLSMQREELARSKGLLEVHVTARTQELELLQRRSDLILNSAGEGICGFNLSGKVTFANPAAARIMACAIAEMTGREADELFADFILAGEGRRGEDDQHAPQEISAKRADGTPFVAEYVRSPLTENGRAVGEVLVFKDITERKHAEETLAHKAEELARSNAELEQFAFVASHDLQEPLRKIQAFGDRLKTKCDDAKLTDGRDYLERMQNAAARMRTLIDDLLTFSRVISRTEPFGPVNLVKVTREVLGDLEVRIEKTGATVTVGELPIIEGDAVQMRQLLQNLIGNALKFQPPSAKPHVWVEGRVILPSSPEWSSLLLPPRRSEDEQDGACELIVKDNGIGFEEKYTEKIFAVFQRLHGRQEYEGTGIGLAVCRRIVERHGGTITARSKLGEGATFVIHLPMRQKANTPEMS